MYSSARGGVRQFAFEQLPTVLKVTGIAGSICGFIYLFSYTRAVGVPFPLELNILPALLLPIGMVSVVSMIILIGGVFLPALIADEPISITKSYFLGAHGSSKIQWIGLLRYFLCSWIPMAMALLAIVFLIWVAESQWNVEAATLLLGGSAFWIVLTPFVIKDFKENRLQYVCAAVFQTAASLSAYFLIIIIFIALYPEAGKWAAWKGFLFVFGVFTLLHMIVTLPFRKKSFILLPPRYEHEVLPATSIVFVFAGVITALSLFMEPISTKVGKTALRAFGIGGGVPVKLCLKSKPPQSVVDNIDFGLDHCSELVSLLFDSGDKVYVAKVANEQEIKKTNNSWSRQDILYFKQDEIRSKIYVSSKGKNKDSLNDESASKQVVVE